MVHERRVGQEYRVLRQEPVPGRGPGKAESRSRRYSPTTVWTVSFPAVPLTPERKVRPQGRPAAGGHGGNGL